MKRAWLSLIVSFGIAAPVVAQQTETERPDEPRPQRAERPTPGRAMGPMRAFDSLPEQLQMDETQRKQFDEIVKAQREKMRDMGRRWEELRQAEEAGDKERVSELRANMEERNPSTVMRQTFEDIEGILHDDQFEKFTEIREQMEQGQEARYNGMRMVQELPDTLKLDEEQRKQYQDLLNAQMEQMRERFRQQREAAENADPNAPPPPPPPMPDPQAMRAAFLEQVETILHDDQKQLLTDYREQIEAGDANGKSDHLDVKTVLRAARRLRLERDQKDDLKTIERDALAAERKIKARDTEAREKLAEKTKEKVAKLLNADQREKFAEALERMEKK